MIGSKSVSQTKSLANAYSQTLGTVFSQEIKPLEVELLVAGLGEGSATEIYRISFDGSIFDERLVAVVGGRSEAILSYLKQHVDGPRPLGAALQVGLDALESVGHQGLRLPQLEVAVLDRRAAEGFAEPPGEGLRRAAAAGSFSVLAG